MRYKKTIYLVRHGETEFNRMGIVQGSGVDSDLNDTGRQQASLFFEQYKHINFDKIYVSGLKRTYQSVQRFIEELNIPYEKMDALNEIRWGVYEGRDGGGEWKSDYYKMIDEWAKGNLEHRIPQGENPLELQARQKPALEHILSKQDEETVLICMHGRAMKSFLCLMTHEPLHNMEIFSHQNLGLYIVAYDGTKFEIMTQNCSKHLQRVPGFIV